MQAYFYFPLGKILIYVFTIVFHSYLLVRATLGDRLVMSALLMIPVISVSLVLIKFLRKTAIRVITNACGVEIVTLFKRLKMNYQDIQLEGNFIKTRAGDYRIFPSKAGLLFQQLNLINSRKNGPGS